MEAYELEEAKQYARIQRRFSKVDEKLQSVHNKLIKLKISILLRTDNDYPRIVNHT
jgi:hypothetical protein